MCLSIYRAQLLAKKLYNEKSRKFWKILETLVKLFTIAYAVLLIATLFGGYDYIAKLTSVVFLGGSIFVLLTVKISSQMNEQILNHIENLELLVYKRTQELNSSQQIVVEQQINLAHASKLSALGEMAGGIAHEINNPLTIISTTCSFLKMSIEKGKYNPEITIKSLNEVEITVMRISKIIQGLKTISRNSIGEDFASVKIKDLMNDVVALCSGRFKNHGVNLDIDLNDPVYDYVIGCSQIQISQIFINLLGNALDAIESLPEKWVKVECRKLGENIEFKIIDSGNGIPKEIQENIFKPFFTTKAIGKGTGLGLSISNSIIKNHNGTFAIDSDNENTCFVISLPSAKTAA